MPDESEKSERLVSIIYGLGIALVGVGVVLISDRMEAIIPAKAALNCEDVV